MKIKDWRLLTDYWDRHPPANELAELTAGWTPPARARAAGGEANLDAFASEVESVMNGGA